MIRSFAALLASLSLLLATPAFAAKAKGHASDAPVRITIAPGVTILVPRGWVACDKETNAALGDIWKPANITSLRCMAPPDGIEQIHMLDPSPLNPVSVLVGYHKFREIDPTVLTAATPDIASKLSADECREAPTILDLPRESVASCSFAIQTLAAHPVLAGNILINMHSPKDRTHVIRTFVIPYGRDSLTLQFETLSSTDAMAKSKIDAILHSLAFDPAVENQPAPPDVSISPAPGFTLSLPVGWVACDTPTNTLLGAVPGVAITRQKSCEKMAPGQTLLAFNPVDLMNVTVGVTPDTTQPITQRQIERMDADDMQKFNTEQCPNVSKPLLDEHATVDSCVITVDHIGGHPALLSTLLARASDEGPLETEILRTYYVPYGEGTITVSIDSPKLSETIVQPLVDAVIKSVTFQ